MNCKVEKSRISGKIVCPTSKSYTHRAIFLASLADGKSIIKNVLRSRDTNATIDACKKFGAKIEEDGTNLIIHGIGGNIQAAKINAQNSGTTIRIASAIACLSEKESSLSGDSSLNQRPMKTLLDALESIGATCSSSNGSPPVTVKGKIKGGEVTIPGNISSQFVSALMIISPLTEDGIILNIEGDLVSKPYLDATIQSMKKFGVEVKEEISYLKYKISPQRYKPSKFIIPSDYSAIALLLSASVLLGDKISLQISNDDLPQADKAIIGFLEQMGIQVINEKNIITTASQEIKGGRFDLSDNPDLLPAISILSLCTSNPIEIFNAKHTRYKETDRISILTRELQKLGIIVHEKDDGLKIQKSNALNSAHLNSENDHRLFMAFCIVGLYIGECTISNPESIDVSYPNFISDMTKVGAKILISNS